MSHWYYRENKDSELVGPMPFNHAHRGCFFLSKDKTKSGTAELVSIMGDRPGDPAGAERKVMVERIYLRGRIVVTGRFAQWYSDTQTPPTQGRL